MQIGRNDAVRQTGEATALDLRGLRCPLPALRTAKALRDAVPGALLAVLADDPLARLDIEHLVRSGGHALVAAEPAENGAFRFLIQRKDDRENL